MFTPPNVSHVTCHMSCVTCHVSHLFIYFFFGQIGGFIGGGSVINGATPSSFYKYWLLWSHVNAHNKLKIVYQIYILLSQHTFSLWFVTLAEQTIYCISTFGHLSFHLNSLLCSALRPLQGISMSMLWQKWTETNREKHTSKLGLFDMLPSQFLCELFCELL